MCELFSLASRLPTVATFSLQTFAQHGGGKGWSVDGWGLAVYADRDARLYKEPEPAVDSEWLRFIEKPASAAPAGRPAYPARHPWRHQPGQYPAFCPRARRRRACVRP
ncbi:MAG: class II glutamine amidotransferase [Pseudolabrys sp.]